MVDEAQATPGVRLRARRNLRLMTAGVLAICLGGLGAAVLYTSIAGTESVVVLRRTVYRGQPIAEEDLGLVSLPTSPGLDTVPAERLEEAVGTSALVDLVEGGLLSPRGFGPPVVDAGSVRLGVRLAPGRLPVGELPPGTGVLLIAVGPDGEAPPGEPSVGAQVASFPSVLVDGASVLDVTVPAEQAEAVARLAAGGRLVVARQAGGSR